MPTGVYERNQEQKERLRKMLQDIGYKAPKGKRLSPGTEFKKGIVPWNKGKERPEMRGENHPNKRPAIRALLSKQKAGALNPMYGKRGPKHHNWKGGKTPLIMSIRNSPKYAEWRELVFNRDKFTCIICEDSKGGNLEAHHKNGMAYLVHKNNIMSMEGALRCDELWDLSNGVTLCKKCHPIGNAISRVLEKIQ